MSRQGKAPPPLPFGAPPVPAPSIQRRRIDDRALALVWIEAWKIIPIPSPGIADQISAWDRYYNMANRSARAALDAFVKEVQ